ncbi:MAG: lactate dehydrogenase, partial [Methanoregula sp.]
LSDTREPAVCSAVLDGEYGLSGCSLGVPVRIGREGILEITEWDLDPWEAEKMQAAGQFVHGLCKKAVR